MYYTNLIWINIRLRNIRSRKLLIVSSEWFLSLFKWIFSFLYEQKSNEIRNFFVLLFFIYSAISILSVVQNK